MLSASERVLLIVPSHLSLPSVEHECSTGSKLSGLLVSRFVGLQSDSSGVTFFFYHLVFTISPVRLKSSVMDLVFTPED